MIEGRLVSLLLALLECGSSRGIGTQPRMSPQRRSCSRSAAAPWRATGVHSL